MEKQKDSNDMEIEVDGLKMVFVKELKEYVDLASVDYFKVCFLGGKLVIKLNTSC